jgi:hypothetical protein
MRLPFPDLVSGLREILGVRLVAYIGGVKSARSVSTWADGMGTPGEVDRERVRHAFYAAALLRERYDSTTVQSWFKGMNPSLDDDAPAHVLREGDPVKGARDVIAVAKAFANERKEGLPIEERPSVRTALRQERLLAEALTTVDVAKLLRVSAGRVRQRCGEGTLFSMSGAGRGLRFPRFQFTDHGELPGWGTVCKALPEHVNPVAVEYFLSHTHPDLAGGELTPAQWLAAGKPAEPVAALAEQAFTIR